MNWKENYPSYTLGLILLIVGIVAAFQHLVVPRMNANQKESAEPIQVPEFRLTEGFLAQLQLIESGNNPRAVGDNGKSRGLFQMSEVAWQQVNHLRRQRGEPQISWSEAFDSGYNRMFAIVYLEWLRERLLINTGQVSEQLLFWAYQSGMQGVLKRMKRRDLPPESVLRNWNKFDYKTYTR